MASNDSFGFKVEEQIDHKWVGGNDLGKPNGKFEVYLPHSCDQWSIAYGKKDQCIKELQSFIDEAKQALEELNKK